MPALVAKEGLSGPRKSLVELMQSINFGRIEGLSIRDSQPALGPPAAVVREHKFGGENGPRTELAAPDFLLKQQVVELFACFDQMRNGVIEVLDIKHGLPFRMVLREPAGDRG